MLERRQRPEGHLDGCLCDSCGTIKSTGGDGDRQVERLRTTEGAEVLVRTVKVITAGTPVQGPDVVVASGFDTVIRQRRHAGLITGRLAFGKGEVTNDGTRILLRDGDVIEVEISNFDAAWFDSDADSTVFEMFVER